MIADVRRQTWRIIGPTKPGDSLSRSFDIFMTILIAANVIAVMIGTVESLQTRIGKQLAVFEAVSVFVFTVEYLLSLWACTVDPSYRHPFLGRLRYATSILAIFDLAAILPFYLMFLPLDLRFMRGLRLVRALRFFKGARYSIALRTLGRVIRAERENLIGTMAVIAIALVMAGSLMFFAEKDAQPEAFSSIPQAIWWGVGTLFKVRVSDIVPVTTFGRVLGAFLAFCGVALVALPAGILSSGFIADIRRQTKPVAKKCPGCGRAMDEG